jgi:hypothetical protein
MSSFSLGTAALANPCRPRTAACESFKMLKIFGVSLGEPQAVAMRLEIGDRRQGQSIISQLCAAGEFP